MIVTNSCSDSETPNYALTEVLGFEFDSLLGFKTKTELDRVLLHGVIPSRVKKHPIKVKTGAKEYKLTKKIHPHS